MRCDAGKTGKPGTPASNDKTDLEKWRVRYDAAAMTFRRQERVIPHDCLVENLIQPQEKLAADKVVSLYGISKWW